MITIDELRKAHENLAEIKEQIAKRNQSFDGSNYENAKVLLNEYTQKSAKLGKYDDFFKMSLADFDMFFGFTCENEFGYTTRLVSKPKAVTCEKYIPKNENASSESAIYDYTIPIEYYISIYKGTSRTPASERDYHRIDILTSNYYLRASSNGETTEDAITKIQDEALTPDRLKNIKINLLLNKNLHLGSSYQPATISKFNGFDLNQALWNTVSNKVEFEATQYFEQLSDKAEYLGSLGQNLLEYSDLDSLMELQKE